MSHSPLRKENRNIRMRSRPSLGQVKAVIEFMQKHSVLANIKPRQIMTDERLKKLWTELSTIVNSISGAVKSTNSWIKYWTDKRRCVLVKQRHIKTGKIKSRLTTLEQNILNICSTEKGSKKNKKIKRVKLEPLDIERASENESIPDCNGIDLNTKLWPNEADERHVDMMEKMAEVMNKQAQALTHIAQASQSHAKSLGRLADASYQQAVAVDRLAGSFQNIGASMCDVRNALVNIDYLMKRCLTGASTQTRQNNSLFI